MSDTQDIKDLALQILQGNYQPTADELVSILRYASDEYNNTVSVQDETLTDDEYDALELMLRAIDPDNPMLSQVGSEVRGSKVDLPFQMGSLDQVYEGDTIKWVASNKWQKQKFCITDKADGTSGLIVYGRNGLLQIAYSRGNGIQGADITRHIKRIKGVPSRMPQPCAVRIEVVIDEAVFAEFARHARSRGERVYRNARNYVAGRMNASESPDWFYQNVRCIGTSVVDPEMGKHEQLLFMKDAGFEVPAFSVVMGSELTDDFLIQYLANRRKQVKYAIDGIVIDLDDHGIRVNLWRNSSSLNPMYSKKFKVGSEENVAYPEVVKVHWEPSKDAYVKPRIEIKPVELVGVTITYCTGFNAKFIRDNKIGPGAKIQITRAGDVIPFCQKVIQPTYAQMPSEDEFGPMKWTEGEVDLYIVDPSNNPIVQKNILLSVFSPTQGLDVPFLREGSINKLFAEGYNTPASIIKAPLHDLQRIVGDSAGEKIYEGLRAKLNPVPLWMLAGASQTLGRGIGRRRMKRLLEALPEISQLTIDNIVKVEGFDLITAKTIVSNLPKFKAFLAEIKGYYTLEGPKEKIVDGPLSGINVCFTGVRDKVLEDRITAGGGTIATGINKNTTHLVAKDKNSKSGKMAKAADFMAAGSLTILSLAEANALWR